MYIGKGLKQKSEILSFLSGGSLSSPSMAPRVRAIFPPKSSARAASSSRRCDSCPRRDNRLWPAIAAASRGHSASVRLFTPCRPLPHRLHQGLPSRSRQRAASRGHLHPDIAGVMKHRTACLVAATSPAARDLGCHPPYRLRRVAVDWRWPHSVRRQVATDKRPPAVAQCLPSQCCAPVGRPRGAHRLRTSPKPTGHPRAARALL
jgi:hypothetical protein